MSNSIDKHFIPCHFITTTLKFNVKCVSPKFDYLQSVYVINAMKHEGCYDACCVALKSNHLYLFDYICINHIRIYINIIDIIHLLNHHEKMQMDKKIVRTFQIYAENILKIQNVP